MYAVIRFFNPDKDLFDHNWDTVFLKHLPHFITAKDSIEYMQAVAAMYANMQDSHGFAWDAVTYALAPFFGKPPVPACVKVEKVEKRMVVTVLLDDSAARKEGLEVGDIVLSVDGRDPIKLIDSIGKYFPTSNNETKFRDLGSYTLCGRDSTVAKLFIKKRDGRQRQVNALRSIRYIPGLMASMWANGKREMPVCRVISGNIGYIDMLQLNVDNIDSIMNVLRHTKAIIFDDRSYPPHAAQQLFRCLPLPPADSRGLNWSDCECRNYCQ